MSLQDFYAKYGNSYQDKINGINTKRSSNPEIDLIDLFIDTNKNKKKKYTAQKNEIRNDWLLYYGDEVIKVFSDYKSLEVYCDSRNIKFNLVGGESE